MLDVTKSPVVVNLRPVTHDDSARLFAWQHEPGARQFFNNPAVPSASEHEAWFSKRLAMRNPHMWIIEAGERAIGYVRLDQMADRRGLLVSILIAGDSRKAGYGHAALLRLRDAFPDSALYAEVDPSNRASERLFEQAHYRRISERLFVNESSKLADIDVCYCENEAAWRHAVEQGLSPQATVRTSNPSFLMNVPEGATVVPVEQSWTAEKLMRLSASVDDLTLNLRKAVAASPFAQYADLLARDAFIWSFRMPWAITLNEADFSEPRAVISIDHGSPAQNKRGYAHWEDLLGSNPRLIGLKYTAEECGIVSTDPRRSPSRRELLKFYPPSYLEFTFWRELWKMLPPFLSRGTVYLGTDNPGLRETAIHFARRGFAIVEAQRPRIRERSGDIPDALRASITPILRQYLAPWVSALIQDKLISLYFDELAKSLAGFNDAMAQWKVAIAQWKKRKPVAFLSNIILQTAMLPLRPCLKSAGVPLVLFQHGHSRELTKHLQFNRCITEEGYCDLFICYDDKANEFVNSNPHRQAVAVTSGAPDLYWKQNRIPDDECGEIGYVQTVPPGGGLTVPFSMTWTDLKKDRFEKELFERCLSRLPHSVTVKPYLTASYHGKLESTKVAEQTQNMNIYAKGLDLRYIVRNFRVLIASRGSSTLGWCLLADRPLVYLDLPDQYPLWEDTRADLEQAVFFFDMAAPNTLEELRTFLSQPLDIIEREWKLKEPSRKQFIGRYLSSGPKRYGKRSFDSIMKFVASRRGMTTRAE